MGSIKTGKYLTLINDGTDVKMSDEASTFKVHSLEKDSSYQFESVDFAQKYLAVESVDDDIQKLIIRDVCEFSSFQLLTNEEDGAYSAPVANENENDNEE